MSPDAGLDELVRELSLPDGARERLESFAELVAGAQFGLTSSRDRETGIPQHIADSLTGLAVPALRDADAIADLGSGGGFPGIVLAIALPGASVTLVESVGKKAAFLERAVARLGLANVAVVAARVEEWHAGEGTQAAVTARALAPLGVLVEYAAPILRVGGALVAWKGPAVASERADADAAAELLGMSAPEELAQPAQNAANSRRLYVSSKLRDTPPGYPRSAGKATQTADHCLR